MSKILVVFVVCRFGQYLIEKYLAKINRQYYLDPVRQKDAMRSLGISHDDFGKTLTYSRDKYQFSLVTGWSSITLLLVILVTGGLGYVEDLAKYLTPDESPILTGLVFFGVIALGVMLYGMPFSAYNTFVIEARHGFNRQTAKGFILDQVKGLLLAAVLGGAILSLILWIMETAGNHWWIWAWVTMSGFSILTAWLYPALLAPLFNKFTPLEDGELKERIFELAEKVHFNAGGLFVMDASIRSSHGNAYFTGMFGKKRIVLFDTLIESMKESEVVAVLAHELGHFKLNHVRWMLIRGVLMTGLTFYLLSLCLPYEDFYLAFGLDGVSSYGALIVFSLWFGLVDFFMSPIETYLSRRNEFAADKFALEHIEVKDELARALLKLRQKSQAMPISHPVYSGWYYSHPPMLERLRAMNFQNPAGS